MPPSYNAEHALRLVRHISRHQYICRACRGQALREFHSSRLLLAEQSFFQRMRERVFGGKDSKAEQEKREVVQKKQSDHAKRDAARSGLEVKVDRRGKEFEVARTVDTSVNPDYVPSANWDGLRRIGSEKWIKEKRDQGEKYVGFMPAKRVLLDDQRWEMLLHHVTVEVLALKNAGRDLNDICLARKGDQHWRETRRTTIVPLNDAGNPSLQFKSAQSEQRVLDAIPMAVDTAKTESEQLSNQEGEELDVEEAESTTQQLETQALSPGALGTEIGRATPPAELKQYTSGSSWLSIGLKDPMVKLAILKRISQLTGNRIPDPAMSSASTFSDLYNALKAKEAPRKLAKDLAMAELNEKISNIKVHPSRRTSIHKEKDVGRWKIIEDELVARDLPVTGSRWVNAKPRYGVERR